LGEFHQADVHLAQQCIGKSWEIYIKKWREQESLGCEADRIHDIDRGLLSGACDLPGDSHTSPDDEPIG
jgi:hypothetical protein